VLLLPYCFFEYEQCFRCWVPVLLTLFCIVAGDGARYWFYSHLSFSVCRLSVSLISNCSDRTSRVQCPPRLTDKPRPPPSYPSGSIMVEYLCTEPWHSVVDGKLLPTRDAASTVRWTMKKW
jgi:hypothetical protein